MFWYIVINESINTDYAVGIVQIVGGVISGSFSVHICNSVVHMYSMRETKVCCEQLQSFIAADLQL